MVDLFKLGDLSLSVCELRLEGDTTFRLLNTSNSLRHAAIDKAVAVAQVEGVLHASEIGLTSTEGNDLWLICPQAEGLLAIRILTLFNPVEANAAAVAKVSRKLA